MRDVCRTISVCLFNEMWSVGHVWFPGMQVSVVIFSDWDSTVHIYFYYLRGSVWISIMTSVPNVRHRGQPETAMTSSLLHATKSNQVSYIDVEVDSNDSLSVREGWKEGGDSEPEGDGRCKHCGRTLLKMAGVALSGVVFGIAMEKSRGNSAQNDHIFTTSLY